VDDRRDWYRVEVRCGTKTTRGWVWTDYSLVAVCRDAKAAKGIAAGYAGVEVDMGRAYSETQSRVSFYTWGEVTAEELDAAIKEDER
jgi:hypothetical protein